MDAQQNISNATHNNSRPLVKPERSYPPSNAPNLQVSGKANQSAMLASNRDSVCDKKHHPPPPTVILEYRPPVQHAHTDHMTYYDHFDDREQGSVLVSMSVGAGKGTHEDAQPSMVGTHYEFMEQRCLENGIVACECTAYGPISLLPDPSNAVGPVNVPIHVADRRADKELHPSK